MSLNHFDLLKHFEFCVKYFESLHHLRDEFEIIVLCQLFTFEVPGLMQDWNCAECCNGSATKSVGNAALPT